MNPFFFGNSGRQLFGAYEPARQRSTRGAVICYPWAREYLLAHPTIRHLAQRLADSGWHSLRFDYFGTGDSAGDLGGASRQQWVEDVGSAIDELKDMAQVSEVALIGMRLGASLASLAAQQRRDIGRLVLWDPVVDGRRFLAEFGVDGGPLKDAELLGTVLPAALRQDIEGINDALWKAGLPRTFILTTTSNGDAQALGASLGAMTVPVTVEHVPDVQVWRAESGRGGVGLGVAAVDRIVSWLE